LLSFWGRGVQGNSIHAQIYPPAHERFKDLVKEGSVYNFSCFKVKSSYNYKPVANNVMLSFSKWTTIEEVVEVPPGFPTMTYSLTPIEQIRDRLDKKEYFTGKDLILCDLLCQYDPVTNLCVIDVQIRCHWSSCCSLKCHHSTWKGRAK
jgi:hypothetical protein